MLPTSPHGGADMQDETALHVRLRSLEQENARLLEEQWTHLQETRALTGIGRLLSERLDPDVVGGRIAESLRSLVGGGSAVVYRLDDESTNLLAMAVAHGPAAPTAGWRGVREIGSGPTRPRSPSSTPGSSRRRSGAGVKRRYWPTWPARSGPRPSSPPCSAG